MEAAAAAAAAAAATTAAAGAAGKTPGEIFVSQGTDWVLLESCSHQTSPRS